jgi:ribonuclease P protein component
MTQLARLRTSADFRRVRETGVFWRGRKISLNAARRPEPDGALSRVGLIATKRVGGAVQRNRARRLMREALRGLMPRVSTDWDLVFIAQPGLLEGKTGFLDAQGEVAWLLNKARAILPG